jgi:hypothetical protein
MIPNTPDRASGRTDDDRRPLTRALNLYDVPTNEGSSAESSWTKYTPGTATDAPNVSRVSGYWVYAEENGSVATNVPAGVTWVEFTELTSDNSDK